jgi:hypothetical protein
MNFRSGLFLKYGIVRIINNLEHLRNSALNSAKLSENDLNVIKLLVPSAGGEACFGDRLLDTGCIEFVFCAGNGNHVLLDHDGAEIVGAGMKTKLCCLLSDRQPGSLDIGYVGEHDPADGDHADVFLRGDLVHDPELLL